MPSMRLPTGFADRYGKRRIVLLMLLMALAAFTFWLQWYNRPSPPAAEGAAAGPDYYLRNFTLTVTGADGLPRYVIDSEYMEYVAGQETLTFLRPSLFVDDEEQHTTWRIEGRRARVTGQGRWIRMQGEVTLKQHDEVRNETVRLETDDLLVLPKQRRAESSSRVSLMTRDALVEGVGLWADLAQGRLELLHQVRGRYRVPPS